MLVTNRTPCLVCDITRSRFAAEANARNKSYILLQVISHTRQGVRFVTGIGFCGRFASCDIAQILVISYTRQQARLITGQGYGLLRALGFAITGIEFCGRSASCDITHETGGIVALGSVVL